jgi:hypothetical protein
MAARIGCVVEGHGESESVPNVDQASLTQAFNFDDARRAAPSFDKCYREVTRLLGAVRAREGR